MCIHVSTAYTSATYHRNEFVTLSYVLKAFLIEWCFCLQQVIFIALVTYTAVVLAAPQEYQQDEPAAQQYSADPNEVYVVNSTYIHEGAGKFYSLEIKSDGSSHEQRGFFKNGAQVIIGTYTHPDETGTYFSIKIAIITFHDLKAL